MTSQMFCVPISASAQPESLQSLKPTNPTTSNFLEEKMKSLRPPPLLERKSREEIMAIIMSTEQSSITSPMTTNSNLVKDIHSDQSYKPDCFSISSDAEREYFVMDDLIGDSENSKRMKVGEIYSAFEMQNKLGVQMASSDDFFKYPATTYSQSRSHQRPYSEWGVPSVRDYPIPPWCSSSCPPLSQRPRGNYMDTSSNLDQFKRSRISDIPPQAPLEKVMPFLTLSNIRGPPTNPPVYYQAHVYQQNVPYIQKLPDTVLPCCYPATGFKASSSTNAVPSSLAHFENMTLVGLVPQPQTVSEPTIPNVAQTNKMVDPVLFSSSIGTHLNIDGRSVPLEAEHHSSACGSVKYSPLGLKSVNQGTRLELNTSFVPSAPIYKQDILGALKCKLMKENYSKKLEKFIRHHEWIQEQQIPNQRSFEYSKKMRSETQIFSRCEDNQKSSNTKQSRTRKRKADQAPEQMTAERKNKVKRSKSDAKTKQAKLSCADDGHKEMAKRNQGTQPTSMQIKSPKIDLLKDGPGELHSLNCMPARADGDDSQAQLIGPLVRQKKNPTLCEQKKTQCNDNQDRIIQEQQHISNHQLQVPKQPESSDRQLSKGRDHDQRSYQQQQQLQDQKRTHKYDRMSVQLEQQPPLQDYQRNCEFRYNCQPNQKLTNLVTRCSKSHSPAASRRLGTTYNGETLRSLCAESLPSFTATISSSPDVKPSPCNPEPIVCKGIQSANSQYLSNSALETSQQELLNGGCDVTSCNNHFIRRKQNSIEKAPPVSFNRNRNNTKMTPKDLVSWQLPLTESFNFTSSSELENYSTLFLHNGAEKVPNSDEGGEFDLDTSEVESQISQAIRNVNLRDETMPYCYDPVSSAISTNKSLNHSEDFKFKIEPWLEEGAFYKAGSVQVLRDNILDTSEVKSRISQAIQNVNLRDETMPYCYDPVSSAISTNKSLNHSEDSKFKIEPWLEEGLF